MRIMNGGGQVSTCLDTWNMIAPSCADFYAEGRSRAHIHALTEVRGFRDSPKSTPFTDIRHVCSRFDPSTAAHFLRKNPSYGSGL